MHLVVMVVVDVEQKIVEVREFVVAPCRLLEDFEESLAFIYVTGDISPDQDAYEVRA
jgi:acetone carboxylase gamma subunit